MESITSARHDSMSTGPFVTVIGSSEADKEQQMGTGHKAQSPPLVVCFLQQGVRVGRGLSMEVS